VTVSRSVRAIHALAREMSPFTAHFSHKFDHKWERVSQAFWLKYSSPRMTHMKEVIVLHREVDSSGRMSSRRLLIAQLAIPKILTSLVTRRIDSWYAIEDTVVDPKLRLHNVTIRNLSFSRLVEAVQQGSFHPSPGNEDQATEYETTVQITCNKSFPGFLRSRAEAAMAKEQSKSYAKTISVMEEVCEALRLNPDFAPPPRSSTTTSLPTAAEMIG
jgi:hypothetical protein